MKRKLFGIRYKPYVDFETYKKDSQKGWVCSGNIVYLYSHYDMFVRFLHRCVYRFYAWYIRYAARKLRKVVNFLTFNKFDSVLFPIIYTPATWAHKLSMIMYHKHLAYRRKIEKKHLTKEQN